MTFRGVGDTIHDVSTLIKLTSCLRIWIIYIFTAVTITGFNKTQHDDLALPQIWFSTW